MPRSCSSWSSSSRTAAVAASMPADGGARVATVVSVGSAGRYALSVAQSVGNGRVVVSVTGAPDGEDVGGDVRGIGDEADVVELASGDLAAAAVGSPRSRRRPAPGSRREQSSARSSAKAKVSSPSSVLADLQLGDATQLARRVDRAPPCRWCAAGRGPGSPSPGGHGARRRRSSRGRTSRRRPARRSDPRLLVDGGGEHLDRAGALGDVEGRRRAHLEAGGWCRRSGMIDQGASPAAIRRPASVGRWIVRRRRTRPAALGRRQPSPARSRMDGQRDSRWYRLRKSPSNARDRPGPDTGRLGHEGQIGQRAAARR